MTDHLHFSSAEANRFMVADAGDGDVAFEIDDTEHTLTATLVLSEVYDVLRLLQKIIDRYNVVPGVPGLRTPPRDWAELSDRLNDPRFRERLSGILTGSAGESGLDTVPGMEGHVSEHTSPEAMDVLLSSTSPGCACDEFMPNETPDEHQARVHAEPEMTTVPDPGDPEYMPPRCPWLYQTRQCELNLGHPGRHTNGPFSWSRGLDPDVVMTPGGVFEARDVEIPTVLSESIPPLSVTDEPQGIRVRFYGSATVMTAAQALALGQSLMQAAIRHQTIETMKDELR